MSRRSSWRLFRRSGRTRFRRLVRDRVKQVDEPIEVGQLGEFGARYLDLQLPQRHDLDYVEAVGTQILHRSDGINLIFLQIVDRLEKMPFDNRVNLLPGYCRHPHALPSPPTSIKLAPAYGLAGQLQQATAKLN